MLLIGIRPNATTNVSDGAKIALRKALKASDQGITSSFMHIRADNGDDFVQNSRCVHGSTCLVVFGEIIDHQKP